MEGIAGRWPLLCMVGPTAVGKTRLSLEVARRLGGEIISGDSMQVYRGMDIGTAKPAPEERRGIPHHLIDILDPGEPFSVADFQRRVFDLLPRVVSRRRLPMLVGGTGLYLKAVVDQYDFGEGRADWELRERLGEEARQRGTQVLHQRLGKVDPAAAERIHPHDLKRIIRALEVYYSSGRPISRQGTRPPGKRIPLDPWIIGLDRERGELYRRIQDRVDKMIQEGLVQEVKGLLDKGYSPRLPAFQALGYRQLISFLQGEVTLEEARGLIKRDTRRFAKRQLTLFRRDPRIQWFNLDDKSPGGRENEIAEKICLRVAGELKLC